MTKLTFEHCINYIETQLGDKLLDWQKEYLHMIYNHPQLYIIPARHYGRQMLNKAIKLLDILLGTKEISKDEILEYFNNYGLQ